MTDEQKVWFPTVQLRFIVRQPLLNQESPALPALVRILQQLWVSQYPTAGKPTGETEWRDVTAVVEESK